MKQLQRTLQKSTQVLCGLLMVTFALMFTSCGNDDPEPDGNEGITITVTPSSNEDGVLTGNGLKFVITSFPDKTCGVNGTTSEVDKSSYSGGFIIPAYIDYGGQKYKVTSIDGESFPGTITSPIGAFTGFSKLTSIVMPETIKKIGPGVFSKCHSLTRVTIPNSVTSIGSNAFSDCSNLTQVNIPESVKSIEKSTFYGCHSLTNVYIPNSVTSIGSFAFGNCSSLTQVTIPESVTSIDDYPFWKSANLKTIICKPVYPPSIDHYNFGGVYLFNSTTVETIYVPTQSVREYKQQWYYHSHKILPGAENM